MHSRLIWSGLFVAVIKIITLVHIFTWMKLNLEVNRLFSYGKKTDMQYFEKEIINLPRPVKRYLKHVLGDGQKHISYVRLKHSGTFRLGNRWHKIKGVEYFTADDPGFYWEGNVKGIIAKDSYMQGKGNLQIRLLGILKIIDKKDKMMDKAELLRYIAEIPWFPTAFLSSSDGHWESIDNDSARFCIQEIGGIFRFDKKGEITGFEAERYDGEKTLSWRGKYERYKKINGIRIPTSVSVSWIRHGKKECYAKFKIEKIEYDLPKRFFEKGLFF